MYYLRKAVAFLIAPLVVPAGFAVLFLARGADPLKPLIVSGMAAYGITAVWGSVIAMVMHFHRKVLLWHWMTAGGLVGGVVGPLLVGLFQNWLYAVFSVFVGSLVGFVYWGLTYACVA